jgi:hypothetical protein
MRTKLQVALVAGVFGLVIAKLLTDARPDRVPPAPSSNTAVNTAHAASGDEAAHRTNSGLVLQQQAADSHKTPEEADGEPSSTGLDNSRASAPYGVTEAEIIRRGREASAAKMEPGLPDEPIGDWLKKSLGPAVAVEWETNDCGELDGSGQQESVPVCADAEARFPDGRTISIWIVVGSQELQGTDTAPHFSGDPELSWAFVSSGRAGCNIHLAEIPGLTNLPPERTSFDQVNKYCGGGSSSR